MPGVAVVPIGFVSDHMEVIYDLDTEAAATAEKLGLPMARAATPGTDERFVTMLRELVVERAAAERGEQPGPAVRRQARRRLGRLPPGLLPGAQATGPRTPPAPRQLRGPVGDAASP